MVDASDGGIVPDKMRRELILPINIRSLLNSWAISIHPLFVASASLNSSDTTYIILKLFYIILVIIILQIALIHSYKIPRLKNCSETTVAERQRLTDDESCA